MRLPSWLSRFGGTSSARLDAADDLSIVKMGTLRAMLARVVRLIPSGGVTIGKHHGSDGEVWYLPDGSGGGGESTHPFKVAHISGDDFSVQAGTCLGQTIATQTIDVGSTRPVAILAYPQFTLNIFNSEFVYSSSVKTGANAPILVSSTSILSDVNSGITSAGTEARALIAIIDTGNVISQITTGNISGTFANTGLSGTMGGSFNKNA